MESLSDRPVCLEEGGETTALLLLLLLVMMVDVRVAPVAAAAADEASLALEADLAEVVATATAVWSMDLHVANATTHL